MIYLDHNATSPMLAEVRDAMMPWLGVPANPASVHRAGQAARIAVEQAREHVAALAGMPASGVVFTSGATEANHLGIRGAARRAQRIAVGAIEHPSVLGAAKATGLPIDPLPIRSDGTIVHSHTRADLVCCMAANHETGVVQPLPAAQPGRWLHVDGTQAAGRIELPNHASSLVISSHKLGGPGGVGALLLRNEEELPPMLTGGPQERGRRAGTLNTAGIVGFAMACSLAWLEREQRAQRWQSQSARIEAQVQRAGGRVVGATAARVANTICCVFPGLRGDLLAMAFDLAGIAVSAGAACASGSSKPSAVLAAMADPEPAGVLRISLGPRTGESDLEGLLHTLPRVVATARDALLD
jgi:cysteine desulfurase